jgi:proteic killer suppression protein
VDLTFENDRLMKRCNDAKALTREFGPEAAKKLRRRLDDMRAARSLEDCRRLPGRFHELTGDRKGQVACEAGGGLRLVFRAAHNPAPRKADGGLDWSKVTAIVIQEIVNYHG